MSMHPRIIARFVVGGIAVVLLAACSRQAGTAAERPARDGERVIDAQRLDPFVSRGNTGRFAHPAAIPVSTGIPPISIYGELPNTGARTQPPARSLDHASNLRQVTFGAEGADFDPAPSRDGTRVFFASTRHSPTSDIYVQRVGGSAVTKLTSDPAHDVMPSVSPDDQRVAFASNRSGSWDIYVMGAEGGQAIQVTSDRAHELHPSWSPDGRMIAYCRLAESSGRWEIWVTDTTEPSSHTFLTHGLFPQWHPSEPRVLFQRSRDRGGRFFSLWTVDYEDGEAVTPTEVISSASAAVINPSWSPDGRFIACSTVFEPEASRAIPGELPAFADIWVISADGRARTNLTGGWRFNSMPSWGPDGDIFFVSDRAGGATIWSLRPGQALEVAGMGESGAASEMAGAQGPDGED